MTMLPAGSVFVCLTPDTVDDKVIFAQNCDRPDLEVHEVIHVPASDHDVTSKLECTFVSIDQVAHTHAVVMSKAAWMWGAEMGANEHGVCIGQALVRTKNDDCVDQDGLLVQDLVRIGLLRSKTAENAVSVITNLLSEYKLSSHWLATPEACAPASACIIIVDRKELWVLETAGELWAARKMTSGAHAFCGKLTIGTDVDKMSDGLLDKVKAKGWWNPDDGPFDFAKALSRDEGVATEGAVTGAQDLLNKFLGESKIAAVDMFKLLRDQDSGINKSDDVTTVSSMVSALGADGKIPSIHWFTATPHPHWSMFKPVIFCENVNIGSATLSPTFGDEDPAAVIPRFQTEVTRAHLLWEEHGKLVKMAENQKEKAQFLVTNMQQLESLCVQDVEEMVKLWDGGASANNAKAASIFEHMIDLELNFLK